MPYSKWCSSTMWPGSVALSKITNWKDPFNGSTIIVVTCESMSEASSKFQCAVCIDSKKISKKWHIEFSTLKWNAYSWNKKTELHWKWSVPTYPALALLPWCILHEISIQCKISNFGQYNLLDIHLLQVQLPENCSPTQNRIYRNIFRFHFSFCVDRRGQDPSWG